MSLLNQQDIEYINDYHMTVWQNMSESVDGKVYEWLKQACLPL